MKIGLCGFGKAGTEFVKYIDNKDDIEFVLALCRDESKSAGKMVHEVTKFEIANDIVIERISDAKLKNKPEVIIDFSGCSTTLRLIDFCAENGINLVICPTDFSSSEIDYIKHTTMEHGIGTIFAPTLTLGINVMMEYLNKISKVFPTFKFEIIEKHPLSKPKPTRTSVYISNIIEREEVPISSVRLDGYVGLHEVVCADGLERITLVHETCSRQAFARGALFAANFVKDKKGVYNINNVLRKLLEEGEAFYDEN